MRLRRRIRGDPAVWRKRTQSEREGRAVRSAGGGKRAKKEECVDEVIRAPSCSEEARAESSRPKVHEKPLGLPACLSGLDPDQARAAMMVDGPLLITAGPGRQDRDSHPADRAPSSRLQGPGRRMSGHHLLPPRRAEMQSRLKELIPPGAGAPRCRLFTGLVSPSSANIPPAPVWPPDRPSRRRAKGFKRSPPRSGSTVRVLITRYSWITSLRAALIA